MRSLLRSVRGQDEHQGDGGNEQTEVNSDGILRPREGDDSVGPFVGRDFAKEVQLDCLVDKRYEDDGVSDTMRCCFAG